MNEAHLLDYLRGTLSEHDAQEVERWVLQTEENRHNLEQLYYTSHLVDCMDAYEEADVEAALDKFRRKVAVEKKLSSSADTLVCRQTFLVETLRRGSRSFFFRLGFSLWYLAGNDEWKLGL